MRQFEYRRSGDLAGALNMAQGHAADYLAGGTTLIDLMKLDVMRPTVVVDINGLADDYGKIESDAKSLRLGALVRMADVADHPVINRDFPVIAQTMKLAASSQLRNMASLGGNVLQRTRCNYFRDVQSGGCNKRAPGSGCAALDGVNRKHAVLGVSEHCIATYPGDFAQALVALGAEVQVSGEDGSRTVPMEQLHVVPGATPDIETTLRPGDLITRFIVPALPWARRSVYVKVRDRQSYEFALASAAVALDMDGAVIREARIALGGVATTPWRARTAEAALAGRRPGRDAFVTAAKAAFAEAAPRKGNAFKVALGQRTVRRALTQATAMKV
jgi:xanthine dehydrogenase YagS FAD-binding subunit